MNLIKSLTLSIILAFVLITGAEAQIRNNGVQVQEYVYDFADDGGATGAINLHTKDNKAVIPVDAVITGVSVRVETAFVSGDGADVIWGNGDDADGYSGSSYLSTSFPAAQVYNAWENEAALLWDDADDHQIYQSVTTAADGQFIMTIGIGTLTAGKATFSVKYLFPSN